MQLSAALQTQLENLFPELFADKDPEHSRMADGCCFGDGWLHLFEQLCTQIQARVQRGEIRQPVLSQVKQKMGMLTIYWRDADEAVCDLSREASSQSLQICEVCGAPGSRMADARRRFVRVRCEAHAASTAL